MTFEDICKLPEGTILWYKSHKGSTLGKLHFHEGIEAVFEDAWGAWSIKNGNLYTVASDEDAMLYKLENA
jgi:hypothetical protein